MPWCSLQKRETLSVDYIKQRSWWQLISNSVHSVAHSKEMPAMTQGTHVQYSLLFFIWLYARDWFAASDSFPLAQASPVQQHYYKLQFFKLISLFFSFRGSHTHTHTHARTHTHHGPTVITTTTWCQQQVTSYYPSIQTDCDLRKLLVMPFLVVDYIAGHLQKSVNDLHRITSTQKSSLRNKLGSFLLKHVACKNTILIDKQYQSNA